MLYAMFVAWAALIFTPASDVSHVVKARHLERLFRAQEEWAELMDRHDIGPRD
jgi:hypothetical protein